MKRMLNYRIGRKYRTRLTIVLVLVTAATTFTGLSRLKTTLASVSSMNEHVLEGPSTVKDPADDKQNPQPEVLSSGAGGKMPLLSSEELRYIRYGEGDMAVAEDDPRYLNYIRSFVSKPAANVPRTLKTAAGKKHFSQAGQSEYVDGRLRQRQHGFFIECGAVDGEHLSNSLFFELERNWTGLLIEANPAYHKQLLSKNRQAYVLGGCLSPNRRPVSLTFRPAGVFGGLGDNMEKSHADFVGKRAGGGRGSEVTIQCFPLMDILNSLEVRHVDYLSLDVEGPEVEILKSVDWLRLRIDIITVEYRVITSVPRVRVDVKATANKLANLQRLFNETGLYRQVATLNTLDVVFERLDLNPTIES